MVISSWYDSFRFRLTVHLDDKTFVYSGVSPHHNDQFYEKRRNKGRAMAYIRVFPLVDPCPVCGKSHLEDQEICWFCGWQCDSASATPDRCSGGPNYAPLNVIRKRWKEGERNREHLEACPTRRAEIGCFECQYDANPEIEKEDQETG